MLRGIYCRSFCSVVRSSVKVGDSATITKVFTQQDVELFSRLSEDTNQIHLSKYVANEAGFDDIVVHGVLCMGLLSACIGTKVSY